MQIHIVNKINMKTVIAGVFILMEVLSSAFSFEMAKLFNTRSSITSSTLAWNPVRPGEPLPPNIVPIGSGGPAWCRTREHATWVSGALVEDKCRVPFLSTIHVANNYQVLVSLNGSSRIETLPWDSLVAFPANIVSTPDMLLALNQDVNNGAILPGFVDPNERRAHFLRGNDVVKLDEGRLVTEIEPVSYKLTNVQLGDKTDRKEHDDILQELELENDLNYEQETNKEVFFDSPRVVYFGKMKGTVVGLPTAVSGPDIYPVNITWGITNEMSQNRSVIVSYKLPAKSTVKVRLIANILSLEGAYTGQLTSIYFDGVQMKRNIEGLHKERKIIEVRAEFDQVLSLEDGSPQADYPSQNVILLHSTTTTPAPPEYSEGEKAILGSTSQNRLLPQPQGVGVNCAGNLSPTIWILFFFFYIILK
ncbi:UNVERIFIED_CONTAM: hypothetical protein RMT77_009981 [Armadillidium vulgare]